jgi:outer membrane protein OmpA-like peptidoglycan-associated protein
MSGNLLGMVHRHVDQATIDTMASLLSQSRHTMQSAVEQVAPALVGGLAQKASTRTGADELHASLDRVDVSLLDDVPGYLSSNTSHVTQSGTGILGGIFGADLANVIGRLAPSTGLGEAGTSSVMKMLAPIVLAVLARHQRRERLDSGGLAQFLDDQRRDVDAALPASMAGLFGSSEGRYGELGEKIGEDRDRADRDFDRYEPGGAGGFPTGAAADPNTRPGGQPVAEAEGMHPRHGGGGPSAMYKQQLAPERGGPRRHAERSAGLRWMVPLLGVLAIVALAYGLLRHREIDGVETIDPAVHGVQEDQPGVGPEVAPEEVQPRYEPGYGPGQGAPGRPSEPAQPPPAEQRSPGDSPGAPGQGAPERGTPQQRAPQQGAPQQGATDPGAPNPSGADGRRGTLEGEVGAERGAAPASSAIQEGEAPLYLGTLFGAGSSELSTEPGSRLTSLLQLVQNEPDQQVEVRGYAFGANTEETHRLATARAEAVRQWLIDNGVDAERVQAIGGGSSARSQVDVFLR